MGQLNCQAMGFVGVLEASVLFGVPKNGTDERTRPKRGERLLKERFSKQKHAQNEKKLN